MGMAWHGMVWAWHGMVWYGMVCSTNSVDLECRVRGALMYLLVIAVADMKLDLANHHTLANSTSQTILPMLLVLLLLFLLP